LLRWQRFISRRNRAVLERSLQHPDPRVQLYVAKLIYQGERERAEACFAWEQEERSSEEIAAREAHAGEQANVNQVAQEALRLLEQRDQQWHQVREDLIAVVSEMADETYPEPLESELA